ncbi:DUF3405 domain-containing protein [Aspergillus tanneri]|uniref:Uncharacterized protein n=1 Tax=Aspergillus tanneri TaxID=1220188 RepID=A0A5M9MJL1_9EURO|nr:uncharacterized protein ATNIH1004_005885 [Aspergillus tanneri]KAA8647195.1 hypothetical protein ATNIH1004_005885 [Aspergillus tanneri]
MSKSGNNIPFDKSPFSAASKPDSTVPIPYPYEVVRPGDIPQEVRDERFLEEFEPPPHEPGGEGTLRDVRNDRFYHGGLLTLTSNANQLVYPKPMIYDPYPDYNSDEWRGTWKGQFHPCEGPRGTNLDRRNPEDMMSVYPGNQKDFPRPALGAYDAMGLDSQVCVDRYSRYSIYGYSENETESAFGFHKPSKVAWDMLNWGQLQSECFARNSGRYKVKRTNINDTLVPPSQHSGKSESGTLGAKKRFTSSSSSLLFSRHASRSAVIFRVWHSLEWTPNIIHYVRSIIMELSLHSGAEYEVFILVDVKDNIPINVSGADVQHLKDMCIPAEFHNMTIFFNDEVLKAWYPNVGEHRPIFQHFQPVQIFSQQYPNFDYYWQLELDSRFTGHLYHFFDKAIEFARKQPRKYLWERNAYFYVRDAHGPWDRFMQMVDQSMVGRDSVWGPVPKDNVTPIGPKPPVDNPGEDDYEWGVGEEADMITFLPIFDPRETQWTFPNTLWNVPLETPRRAAVVTMSRVSKRLMNLMHEAQVEKGWGIVSEMTPASFALWHGLKAVHVPHPIYVDGQWSPKELAGLMNRGEPDKINGGSDSFWNFHHAWDHIVYRLSFMFATQTAEDLYRRWMGYKADKNQVMDTIPHQDAFGRNWYDSGELVFSPR